MDQDEQRCGEDDFVDSYEDVSIFAPRRRPRAGTATTAQTECTFMWTTKDGDPVGVIMNFVSHDDRFWMTCTRRRKRVAAVEAQAAGRDLHLQPRHRHRRQPGGHVQGRRRSCTRRRRQGLVLPGARRPGPARRAPNSKRRSSITSTRPAGS